VIEDCMDFSSTTSFILFNHGHITQKEGYTIVINFTYYNSSHPFHPDNQGRHHIAKYLNSIQLNRTETRLSCNELSWLKSTKKAYLMYYGIYYIKVDNVDFYIYNLLRTDLKLHV
jgi:hypothetical protein